MQQTVEWTLVRLFGYSNHCIQNMTQSERGVNRFNRKVMF